MRKSTLFLHEFDEITIAFGSRRFQNDILHDFNFIISSTNYERNERLKKGNRV